MTLGKVIRDINLLDDEWTICAKSPLTANSPACVTRTAAEVRSARVRGLAPLIVVSLARRLVAGMEPHAWMKHVIHHAEHDAFLHAA
jgi:hypothetical protein